MYDIDEEKTPCLVFDNFLEEEHQSILSLKGDDDVLKKMMLNWRVTSPTARHA
jgi:hypothetical protein